MVPDAPHGFAFDPTAPWTRKKVDGFRMVHLKRTGFPTFRMFVFESFDLPLIKAIFFWTCGWFMMVHDGSTSWWQLSIQACSELWKCHKL